MAIAALSHETRGLGGPRGDAVTMIEVARNASGTMPRILGVNHHPEIVNRARQLTILRKRMERGEVSPAWFSERAAALTQDIDDHGDQSLRLTSSYTFLAPLRFYLHREAERRARATRAHAQHRRSPVAIRLSPVAGPAAAGRSGIAAVLPKPPFARPLARPGAGGLRAPEAESSSKSGAR